MDDRNDTLASAPPAWDRQFDGAPPARYRDFFRARQFVDLAVAAAVYLALIAGLALHGLDMPDPTPTSSLTNGITAVPAMQEHNRRDRE